MCSASDAAYVPNFYQLSTNRRDEPAGILGALQKRRELVAGTRMIGFECTIDVASIEDTEGNVFGAMQFDKTAE